MNDDGEFELVLGNKQLFSVFFIVVVLLGVCFLMGYVVGKNSAPVLNAAIAPKSGSEPLVIPPATEPKESLDVEELTKALKETAPQAPADKADPDKTASDKAAPEKVPEKAAVDKAPEKASPDKGAPGKEKTVASTPAPKPEPVKAAPVASAPSATPTKGTLPGFQPEKSTTTATTPKQVPLGSQPIPGRVYLQLSATDRDSAEGMADLLRGKGFTAIAAQIPERKELYRVLVGPLNEADIAKARADLKANKFPSDEAVRRVF